MQLENFPTFTVLPFLLLWLWFVCSFYNLLSLSISEMPRKRIAVGRASMMSRRDSDGIIILVVEHCMGAEIAEAKGALACMKEH